MAGWICYSIKSQTAYNFSIVPSDQKIKNDPLIFPNINFQAIDSEHLVISILYIWLIEISYNMLFDMEEW